MFDYFKKIAISNRADDELLYEYVLNEMESGVIVKGLWGKAIANSNGIEANAKSIYMKYRVQSIKDIFTAREIAYNELTKPKLFQYIQDKILPMSSDYTNLTSTQSKPKIAEIYKVSEYEESIYNEVAEELSSGTRKEGLWLKAIQNTDGDENRALSLYIKYRSEAIKIEKINLQKKTDEQRRQEQTILQKEQVRKKAIEEEEKAIIPNKLKVFLKENSLNIMKQISPLNVKANYNNSPIDVNLEYKNEQWQVVN